MLSLLYTCVKPEFVLHLALYVSFLLLNFSLLTIFQNVNIVLAATAIWIALSKDAAVIIMLNEFAKHYNNLI